MRCKSEVHSFMMNCNMSGIKPEPSGGNVQHSGTACAEKAPRAHHLMPTMHDSMAGLTTLPQPHDSYRANAIDALLSSIRRTKIAVAGQQQQCTRGRALSCASLHQMLKLAQVSNAE